MATESEGFQLKKYDVLLKPKARKSKKIEFAVSPEEIVMLAGDVPYLKKTVRITHDNLFRAFIHLMEYALGEVEAVLKEVKDQLHVPENDKDPALVAKFDEELMQVLAEGIRRYQTKHHSEHVDQKATKQGL